MGMEGDVSVQNFHGMNAVGPVPNTSLIMRLNPSSF